MRIAIATIIVLTFAASALSDTPQIEDAVNKAVANAQLLWLPEKGTLKDWTIGLDPAWSQSNEIQQRRREDLDLITATYLYHFVLRAGGSPILSHADRTLALCELPAANRRLQRLHDPETDALLHLVAGTNGDAAVLIEAAPDAASQKLGQCLREALGAGQVTTFDPQTPSAKDGTALTIPTCRISFSRDTSVAPTPEIRRGCYDDARRIFTALQKFAADPAQAPPIRDAQFAKPDMPTASSQSRAASLAKSIWPQGDLPAESLGWFCDAFARAAITNRSQVFFDVTARQESGQTLLTGRTNVPHILTGLTRALAAVGHDSVVNQVKTLPNRDALGSKCFGACRVPMALTFSRPGGGALQTQLLYGEPVFLLDRSDDYFLLHARDGYWGWVHASAIEPFTAEDFNTYVRLPRVAATRDIESAGLLIPHGSVIRRALVAGQMPELHLTDGSTMPVPVDAVKFLNRDEAAVTVRIKAALDMLYVPYVFGGRSSLGIDCSGFATNLAALVGASPARDAWQQALAGQLVATASHRDNITAGDQLFFINSLGKIYHTGIALDATHVVHASPPCVKINSIDPASPLYDRELDQDFFIAKRP